MIQVRAQDTKENADFKLAINLYNDKLYDLALEQLRQFINLYPNTQQGIEARFYLGLAQTKMGKYDDARFTFQNFALAYPENLKAPEAWINVAEAYVALNNLREAALAYERVKTFHPKSKYAPQALLKASEYFERLSDHENAKKVLRSLVQDYSSTEVLPARLKLADIYSSEHDYEAARQECKRVADGATDPALKARAFLMLAQSLVKLGKNSDAENSLQEIVRNLRSTPSYDSALFALGSLQHEAGNNEDAMKLWGIVVSDSLRAPGQLRQDALIEIGDFYSLGRKFSEGIRQFEAAARILGLRRGEAWYKAGLAAEKNAEINKAGDYYRRANNDSAGTVDRRAIVIGAFKAASMSGSFDEALRLARTYRDEFAPDNFTPRILLEAAQISSLQLKDSRIASDLFLSVLEKFPGSPWADEALFGFATTLRQMGSYDEARERFESLRLRFPSSDLLDQVEQRVREIDIFELKNKELGFEKLALLVGDVIAQKGRGDLAYRLAEIYYHELKDYVQAAQQYQAALGTDLETSKRPAAWYFLAKSLEYTSLKEGLEHNPNDDRTAKLAIATYDSLMSLYPANEFADDAITSLFQLHLRLAQSPSEMRKLGTDFLARFPTSRRRDLILLTLAQSYQTSRNYGDASTAYKLLLEKYPDRTVSAEAMFQLGHLLGLMGEKDSSATVLRQFFSKYPTHPRTAQCIFLLAQYESERAHPAEAISYLDRLEKTFFYSQFSRDLDRMRGDAFYNAHDYPNAIVYYRRHLHTLKNDYFTVSDPPKELVYRIATVYESLGNRSEAKKAYAEYLSRDPSSELAGQVYYNLSGIAKAENNLDLAARYLQEAAKYRKGEGLSSVALETAELLFSSDQYERALPKYEEALLEAKNDSMQQYLKAQIIVCYFRLDNIKEADKRMSVFVKSNPRAANDAAHFEFERGRYLLRKDDFEKAKQRFDVVTTQYPNAPIVPEALYWIARTYELDQKLQQAVQIYDSVLALYPDDPIAPRARLGLGNAYYNLEQWDAAAKNYRVILDSEQRSPELVQFAMNNLIMTYKELALYDGALELTRKYIDRFPDDSELINKRIDIGVLYQKLGYYDQSILHLQSLLENANADLEAELRYYIGEGYYYKGEHQQAILEFLKVPYLVSKRGKVDWISTSYYMAGQSYEKMSKYDQAVTMYKQIIDRKDTDTQFKTAAQREIDRVTTLVGKRGN
ncbi:MAG: tetratricopeptide repeat protein [Bacteroidota bacterium]